MFAENKYSLKSYHLRPVQAPYDKSNGDSIEDAMEQVMLNVGEQILNKKPEFDDFKEFTIFKNEEEHIVGCVTHWGITYRGATIGFVVFDDTHASFVPGNDLGPKAILLN